MVNICIITDQRRRCHFHLGMKKLFKGERIGNSKPNLPNFLPNQRRHYYLSAPLTGMFTRVIRRVNKGSLAF